jgi:hypothetical protein
LVDSPVVAGAVRNRSAVGEGRAAIASIAVWNGQVVVDWKAIGHVMTIRHSIAIR